MLQTQHHQHDQDQQYKQERRLLWTLAAIQFCCIADFMMLAPMGPILMRVFAVGPKELGLLVAAYTLSAATAGLLATLFIDKFDRRRALLFLLALFALGELACAVAPDYKTLVLCRMYCGACGGLVAAMIQTIVGDVIPKERQGRALGTVMMAFSFASVAGIPIGLYFASQYGWHSPFIFVFLCAFIAWIAALNTVPSLAKHLQQTPSKRALLKPLLLVLKDSNHLRAYALVTLLMGSSFMVIPYIAVFQVGNVHISETVLSLVYFCGGFATLFTSRLVGRWTDQFGKVIVFRSLSVLAIFSILATTNMMPLPIWVVLLVSTFFMVVVPARMIPTMALVNSAANPAMRGTFISLNGAIQSTVQGVATLASGLIISRTPGGEIERFWLVGLCSVALIGASLFWVNKVRPSTPM